MALSSVFAGRSSFSCGNDIASSCLYVSAPAIIYAGRWAPLALLIVSGVLYFFRSIYGEIVGAILKFFIKGMTSAAQTIRVEIDKINSQQVVFFTRGDNLANLDNAMLYVKQNEHTNRIKVVTVV